MNIIQYNHLENVLRSLADSTYMRIETRGEKVVFDGRNSPHSSHRLVSVDNGHFIDRLVMIGNEKCIVAIFDGEVVDKQYVSTLKLPSYLLPQLDFPAAYPPWVKGIVDIAIVDRFDGYNENGEAQFNVKADAWFTFRLFGKEDRITLEKGEGYGSDE